VRARCRACQRVLSCGVDAVPFSSTSAAAAGDTEQLICCKKMPKIALLAYYNFAWRLQMVCAGSACVHVCS
jgi:hypothetical protein